jgi:hypothetical protein
VKYLRVRRQHDDMRGDERTEWGNDSNGEGTHWTCALLGFYSGFDIHFPLRGIWAHLQKAQPGAQGRADRQKAGTKIGTFGARNTHFNETEKYPSDVGEGQMDQTDTGDCCYGPV